MLTGLRALRKTKGMSQTDMATRAGLTQAAISQLEQGQRQPLLRTVYRVAAALEVEPNPVRDSEKKSSVERVVALERKINQEIVSAAKIFPKGYQISQHLAFGSVPLALVDRKDLVDVRIIVEDGFGSRT